MKSLNQREWHPTLFSGPLVLTSQSFPHPPQKKQGRLKKTKPHFLSKPVNKRLCFFPLNKGSRERPGSVESFAPFHGSSCRLSLTPRGSLLVQSPVVCPSQISFFYLNKKSKVHF